MPPFCDQFFFIHMAWYAVQGKNRQEILERKINNSSLFNRLEMAFESVPVNPDNELAVINDSLPTCDFGFRDVIGMTGEVCFGSLLRYRAALELAEMHQLAGNYGTSQKYRAIAKQIKSSLVPVFGDSRGLLRASTGKSSQPDVWATAFAIYIGALDGKEGKKACQTLSDAYRNGSLAMEGQIRHVLTTDDFSAQTAWEKSLAAKNTYQNGAYWGTATGWVFYAIAQVDKTAARQLASEFISNLRKTDFRVIGPDQGGPYECIYPPTGHKQNPVYMTTVTCPYAIMKTR
jgi:hypothetical protein